MSYVGYSGVANLANTTPGTALGAVANAYNGFGNDVGDHGVVDLYRSPIPPDPTYYILMQTTGFVLQEDSSKIDLES